MAGPGDSARSGVRTLRIAFVAAVALVAVALAAAAWVVSDRAPLDDYPPFLEPAAGESSATRLRVTFLGVSTLLFDDGETAILTDGFFSRPSLWRVALTPLSPDLDRIGEALRGAEVDRLAAVVVLHSHYDHAMDSPAVAERTGALLVGSESTANIARGWGLPAARIRQPRFGEVSRFGSFDLTLLESRHLPHGVAEGTIDAPLVPPARADSYRQGETYSLHVRHPLGTFLVQGSAGFVEGALAGYSADVVFLGVGGLSQMDDEYRAAYFREVVARMRPRWVVPIHYDDFSRPLGQPILAMPRLVDDFDATMRWLTSNPGGAAAFEVGLLPVGRRVTLFAAP